MRPAPLRRAVAGTVVLAFVLAACSESPVERPTPTVSAADPGLATENFDVSELAWQPCDEDGVRYDCATMDVPLNWADFGLTPGRAGGATESSTESPSVEPDAPGTMSPATSTVDLRVALSLKRRPAGDQDARIGTLLINPGGPGASGVEFVEAVGDSFGDRLLQYYDIVGFDPRGVQNSSAVDCLDDAQTDAARQSTVDPRTADGFARAIVDAADYAEGCQANTGELLGYVDTLSSAMDLEAIRKALGVEQLDYLGFSYGTLLGATYADLYPERVGRFVLDGALDPSASYQDLGRGQAKGFENALRAYAAHCSSMDKCPLSGTTDQRVQQIRDFLAQLDQAPLSTGESARPLTSSIAASALLYGLYSDSIWPHLNIGLERALKGDGSYLLWLADVSAERDENGHYLSNASEAFTAINCLDYPMLSTESEMKADAEELAGISPTFGRYLAFGGVQCRPWPYAPVRTPTAVTPDGVAPVLVVGTTGDPATPYEYSEALTRQLGNATLLTFDGEGHTAYGKQRSNSCIIDAVDGFLVDGVMPATGKIC